MPVLKRDKAPDLYYEIDDYTDPWRSAPYILLQHGFGRSSKFWYRCVPYLARYYKIVRPDLRGFGRSSPSVDPPDEFTVASCINDLESLIAVQRLAKVIDTTPFLSRIEAPMLAIYPSKGPITTPEQEELLRKHVRNLRLVHLNSEYHNLHLTQPAACARHLLHFVAQHDGIACHEA